MEIGIEDLAFAQLHPFGRLRFLDLDDHVGLFEHVLGCGCDLRASGDIGVVIGTDPGARTRLNQDIMAMRHIFSDGTGGQTDTVFMVFDFLRATDTHEAFLSLIRSRSCFVSDTEIQTFSAQNVLAK